jgi:hypothetical protein
LLHHDVKFEGSLYPPVELSNESALTEERKRVSLGEEKKKRKEGKKIGTNELFDFLNCVS